jgi:hypothetical protein
MSHSHKFSKNTLRYLAGRVSEKLSPQSAAVLSQSGSVEIAETFEIWFLGRTATARPYAPLSQIAHRTGTWHHQIRHNGHAQEYAVSRPYGPGARDWEVKAVMLSDLAPQIDDAIAWIDGREIDGDPLVRLLVLPAYHATAFWLEGGKEDRILLVTRPDWFQHLQKEQLYGKREFLTSLALERTAQATPWRTPRTSAPANIIRP